MRCDTPRVLANYKASVALRRAHISYFKSLVSSRLTAQVRATIGATSFDIKSKPHIFESLQLNNNISVLTCAYATLTSMTLKITKHFQKRKKFVIFVYRKYSCLFPINWISIMLLNLHIFVNVFNREMILLSCVFNFVFNFRSTLLRINISPGLGKLMFFFNWIKLKSMAL